MHYTRTKEKAILTIVAMIFVCWICNIIINLELHREQLKAIEDLNRETQVMWYVPDHADCAIKMMYFKDNAGNKKPEVRMVCHWNSGMFEPIKPDSPLINMEKLNEEQ